MLSHALSFAAPGALVVAGDFNTPVEALGGEVEDTLHARGLVRLLSAPGRATSLGSCPWGSSDDSGPALVIDHVYSTAELRLAAGVEAMRFGELPPPPRGPWAAGSDGSDHAWLRGTLVSPQTAVRDAEL